MGEMARNGWKHDPFRTRVNEGRRAGSGLIVRCYFPLRRWLRVFLFFKEPIDLLDEGVST